MARPRQTYSTRAGIFAAPQQGLPKSKAEKCDDGGSGERGKESGRSGAWGRIRTTDTRIFNPLLYQLSYPGPGRVAFGGASYKEADPDCPASRLAVFILIAGGGAWNGVTAGEPALQIHVRAALRTEGAKHRIDRFAADGAGLFRGHRRLNRLG